MKQKNFLRFSFLLFICACTGFFIRCSNDDNNNTETTAETFEITTASTDVLPLQAVILEGNIDFTADVYPARFGDQQVELFKTDDGKLVFPIPDVASGNYNLEISVGEKKGSLQFSVGQSDFTAEAADEVVQQELEIPLENYRNELTALSAVTGYPQDLENQIASASLLLDNYFSQLETISAEEKIQLARFYKANPFFTTDCLNVQRNGLSNPEYDCFKVNRSNVIITTITVLAFVELLPTLVSAGPWGSVTAFVGLVAGVTAAACIISAAQERLINDCFYPYKQFLKDEAGAISNFTTTNAQELVLTVKSLRKNLTSDAISSSNQFVSSVASKLTLVKDKWTTIKEGINSIISSASGWFSSWFDSAPAFTGIDFEFAALPSSSPETETETNTDYITVEGIASDVTATVTKSGSTLNLKLEANPATLPRTVTGKIKYDDGDFITEDTFSVTIEALDCNTSNLALTATADGSTATATATGGQPPYTYAWSNGSTGATVSGLEPGEYSVTVTDSNGCTRMASVVIQAYNYKLQIGDYHPFYDLINPVMTLNQGAAVTFPNYMKQMVRLTLDGTPVTVGPNGLPWTSIPFGNVPTSAAPINIPDYSFTIYDATNNRPVEFRLNLTLDNAAYGYLVGTTVTVNNNQIVTFNGDGTMDRDWTDGTEGETWGYTWEGDVISPSHVTCDTSVITTTVIGVIFIPFGDSSTFPEYILIEEGGTFRSNSYYGCEENLSYIPIE